MVTEQKRAETIRMGLMIEANYKKSRKKRLRRLFIQTNSREKEGTSLVTREMENLRRSRQVHKHRKCKKKKITKTYQDKS